MLLYPDQRVTQPENETVCFAAPIDLCDWEHLYSKARYNVVDAVGMRYLIIVDESTSVITPGVDVASVYFMRNEQEVTDQVAIIFRRTEDEDTCIETAAWIRIKENYPGMIYIVRGSSTGDHWQTHAAAIGAPEGSVAMVDFNVIEKE